MYKIFAHFQKFSISILAIYYVVFVLLGLCTLYITFILAFSGALPNHYVDDFNFKLIYDLALVIGFVNLFLSIAGIIILIVKQVQAKRKKYES
ncbi:MAG: hypothetical protein IPM51_17465 [Sphingobacteriaceae bacterium]|nr:hypothetical protein [Sphingobacteriaceae bacterium]MBK9286087.1 hypothetical protein [Sphingobacteriaceae bacterium]